MKYEIITPSSAKHLNKSTISLDGFEIYLDKNHPLPSALSQQVTNEDVRQVVNNSRLFVVNDQVVDHFVPSNPKQKTFVHEDNIIKQMIKNLGFEQDNQGNLTTNKIHDRYEFNDTDTAGGQFSVDIGYKWSPFKADVTSFSTLARFVCSNTMSTNDPSLTYFIPLINAWEENIKISNQALRYSMDNKVRPRLQRLYDSKASAWDVILFSNILNGMLNAAQKDKNVSIGAIGELGKIKAAVDQIFGDDESEVLCLLPSMQKMIPAPINAFDLFNFATECDTHYYKSQKLEGFANSLIFDAQDRQRQMSMDLDHIDVDGRTFNSIEDAFAGEVIEY